MSVCAVRSLLYSSDSCACSLLDSRLYEQDALFPDGIHDFSLHKQLCSHWTHSIVLDRVNCRCHWLAVDKHLKRTLSLHSCVEKYGRLKKHVAYCAPACLRFTLNSRLCARYKFSSFYYYRKGRCFMTHRAQLRIHMHQVAVVYFFAHRMHRSWSCAIGTTVYTRYKLKNPPKPLTSPQTGGE